MRIVFQPGAFLTAALLLAGNVLADDWWAVRPLDRAALKNDSVDAFIHATLAEKGLQPAPPADRRTLIRRACYDLTGLPPTPAEVDAFAKDDSPQAYARLIERLLASPHHGEQWARHWLDVARYSDTKGYVYAREERRWVHATPYRDWVVRALNDDMPYDRFLRLQLAADQLVPAGSPDLAAMGFLTLGRRFLGVTHDIIDDRIDVVTRGMMGLTVACARCHDHKYDPIPTRDYYALYGVFQSSEEKMVPCGMASGTTHQTELRAREKKLRETMSQRREEQSARVRATVKEHLIAQLELEKYPEEVFGQILDANDINPVFVRRWQLYLSEDEKQSDPVFAEWHQLRRQKAPIVRLHESAARYGELFARIEARWRELKKTHPSASSLTDPAAERLRSVLYGSDSPCTIPDEHITNIEMHFNGGVVVELWKLQGEVDRWLLQSTDAPPQATVLIDRARAVKPRVFVRGNPLTKGDATPRQFLTLFGAQQPFTRGSGRLELAEAITSPHNPLTARVIANRVWQHHFGQGLVATPGDFGTRADPPSHPALLDWLALRLIDSGWSLKSLHRDIMLSQTYQQSSKFADIATAQVQKHHQADPGNRWLWRMTPRRLSFEEARDSWLAAAGELNARVGGQPEALFAKGNSRRTLYALVDRENVPSVLRAFDFANPDLSIPQRAETTVPQQALFGMNHPFIAGRAAALVKKLPAGDAAARVRHLYSRLHQRQPSTAEMSAALAFVAGGESPPPPSQAPQFWTYGYGEFDEATGRLRSFTPLPHFNGAAWQGGEQWPDAGLGWVQLTAAGGHPGNDRRHAAVRRWTAPQDGSYDLRSTLIHEPEAGDGIRAFVSHGARGLLRSAALRAASEQIDLGAITMNKGDTLDFIVDIRNGLNSDQFLWSPKLALSGSAGSGGDTADQSWDAERDFAGAKAALLDPWQQFAQVLMLSNEFMFVD